MRKSPARTARRPQPVHAHRSSVRWPMIGLLGLTVMLALTALLLAWNATHTLPALRAAQMDPGVLNAAFQQAHANLGADGRTAFALTVLGRHFTDALVEPEVLPARLADARATVAQLTRSQFGRVQLAAFELLRLERAGVLPEQGWPHVSPYLSGLEQANLGHLLPELIDSYARTYERLGLGPASARRLAESFTADDHGPLLQYVTSRCELLELPPMPTTTPTANTAPLDASPRRVIDLLLRDWVLTPGPAQVRLLAAELLAQRLARRAAQSDAPPQFPAIASGLRAWRAAYHAGVAARGPASPLLVAAYTPSLHPFTDRWLRPLVLSGLWTGAGLLACLATLVITAWHLLSPSATPSRTPQLLKAAAAGALFALVGLAWPLLAPATAADDLHRITAMDTGGPRTPWVALLVALVCVAAVPVVARRGQRWHALAITAVPATAVLAIILILHSLTLSHGIARYERDVAALQRAGTFAELAGPDADRHLAELRAWEP